MNQAQRKATRWSSSGWHKEALAHVDHITVHDQLVTGPRVEQLRFQFLLAGSQQPDDRFCALFEHISS